MKFKKTKIMISLATCISLISLAGCGSNSSQVGAKPDAKPKVLNVLYATVEADDEAIKAEIPEYEKETGIKINLTTEPYNNLQQKVFQELGTKSSHYDVMLIDTPWMPALTGELLPITSYLEKPELAKEVNISDFIPKVFFDTSVYNPSKPWVFPPANLKMDPAKIKAAGFEIYGLPMQANGLTVAYRKDLFDDPTNQADFKAKYGRNLEMPNTWDEFLQVAQFFTRPDKKLWGTTLMPGTTNQEGAHDFKSFLGSWGGNGRLLDDKVMPEFDSPQAVEALTFYRNLINKYKVVPPGTQTFGWDEAGTAFGSGLVAMTMGFHTVTLSSNVKGGKIDYAMFPGKMIDGKLVRGPHFGTWQLSINKYSQNQDAAFNMIQWFTSQKTQEKMLDQQLHPTRTSVYQYAENNPQLTEKFGQFYKVLGEELAVGVGRPRISDFAEVANALSVAVSNVVTKNADPKSELKHAKNNIISLLKQAGYDPGNQ